jgi:hypothetical protein
MLFDPDRHEPLLDAAWDPAGIARAIGEIVDDAARAGPPWRLHPLDREEGDPDVFHGIYLGAAGIAWALHELLPGYEPPDLLAAFRAAPDYQDASLFVGEGGIAFVSWLLAPSEALADRLFELMAVPERDTVELMWGSPGQLVIADAMFARTGEPRWAAAADALSRHLLSRRDDDGFWTQDLYGKRERNLGPVHGFTGVVGALGPRLPVAEVTAALAATAIREDGYVNWPPGVFGPMANRYGEVRVQWCHGAPGMIAATAGLERDEQLDALLLAGGELTWAVGPLRKGAGLCHGTAGNGLALLWLFARTGDERWLERARRFAMHAAAQVAAAREEFGHGRYSLWTGDLGTALFLARCLSGDRPEIVCSFV